MKKILLIGFLSCIVLNLTAQNDSTLQAKMDIVKAQLQDYNTERLLDSLDQEKLPRLVSGGLFAGTNISNFIINRDHHTMSSHMRVGGELGGFIDFCLTKNFAIQPQVILFAQENYFSVTDSANHLWSFGMEIPVYFLGRFGNMEKGYVQFGGGIFTHFTFASNIANKYKPVDPSTPTGTNPAGDGMDYSRLYSLHNNHFGLCLMIGYELPLQSQPVGHRRFLQRDERSGSSERPNIPAVD